ncbi:MAG: peptidoglycan-binding protein [Alkalinema sp. RU_4_3]|nr:peptidoglycan-binding protein [Alkalinema sp. RU_4_3]
MICRGVSVLGLKSARRSLGLLLGLGLALSAMPAKAQYSSDTFVAVLEGIGYSIEPGATLDSYSVRQAIQSIQQEANLPVTGRLDSYTEVYTENNVKLIQRQLNQVLGLNLPSDQPFYGPLTRNGITQFQRTYGLAPTGIADMPTRQVLQQAVSRVAIIPTKTGMGGDNPNRKDLYTDMEFRLILQGLGYDIDLGRPLTDRPAVLALLDFQRQYGLTRSGTADPTTQNTARSILRQLQENLRQVVDRNLYVTENYDRQTISMLKTFQAKYNLTIDGIATLEVRQRLQAMARR